MHSSQQKRRRRRRRKRKKMKRLNVSSVPHYFVFCIIRGYS